MPIPPRNNGEKSSIPGTTNTSASSIPSDDSDERKTHIEVCARIRPLQIRRKRDSFFDKQPKEKSGLVTPKRTSNLRAPRKPPVPSRESTPATPPSPEQLMGDTFVAWDVTGDGDTASQSPLTPLIQGRTHSYTLDKVYDTSSSTKELYENSIQSLVKAAMEGYHSSVLAYGQTSTGKTFTMTGTPQSPGIIPLCITDCFNYLKDLQENRDYLLRFSYLEVYKEHIRDLLATTPQPIRLFDSVDGLIIRGLKEEIITSPEQVFALLEQGEARRQVGATQQNLHSSRSHVMVRLWIESSAGGSKNVARYGGNQKGQARVSSLSLVDLAGSESVRLNGTERREEGQYINKSLMTLGQVVLSLSEKKSGHVPYRDSKLTRLLQPSLSGNAQMVLLCCISPQASHLEESHNTFKFATRAKKIKQKAVVNVIQDEEKTLLQSYRDEIADLKQQLKEAKNQQQTQKSDEKEAVEAESKEEVQELVEAIKTMERLILKSRAQQTMPLSTSTHSTPKRSESKSDDDDDDDLVDLLADDQSDGADDLLEEVLGEEETAKDDDELNSELHRIRGLLGSVLKKRGVEAPTDPSLSNTPQNNGNRGLSFATPTRPVQDTREVQSLRKQLEEQEVSTNLRKADSSFLQSQLQEKDQLLEEVSKILEAVEQRQSELERENNALKEELRTIKRRYCIK